MHSTPPFALRTLINTDASTTPTAPGFYLRTRPYGFAAHLCASPQNLCAVRQLAGAELLAQASRPTPSTPRSSSSPSSWATPCGRTAIAYRSWSRCT